MSVTDIRRARWTGGGEVVHIQVCDYPGCRSRHSLVGGPATPGWKSFGATIKKIILCPFHSDGPHLPRLVPLTRDAEMRSECTCGWLGTTTRVQASAAMEWQDHIVEVEFRAQVG